MLLLSLKMGTAEHNSPNDGELQIKERLCQENCALHLTCPVMCNDYSVWASFTHEKLRKCLHW